MQLLQRWALAHKFDAHEARADGPDDPLRASALSGADAYLVGPADVAPEDLLALDEEPWMTVDPDAVIDLSGGAWA